MEHALLINVGASKYELKKCPVRCLTVFVAARKHQEHERKDRNFVEMMDKE